MYFTITAMGTERVQQRFNRMGASLIDAAPAFTTILELIYEIETAIFESQGRRGGGSWRRDSPAWLARKARQGLDPRVGFATQALFRSVTTPGDPGQVLEMTKSTLRFGSRLPYARAQQEHRPFIKWTLRDKARMRDIIKDYIVAAWNA